MTTWLFGSGSSTKPVIYTGVQVQTSALNLPIPIAYGRNRMAFNLIYYTDFEKHKQGSKGGKGGGGKGGTYTYSAAVILGLGWGIISDIPNVYMNQNTITTLANLGFTLFNGTTSQTPWGYVVAHHPTEALSYARIAYIANEKLDLGSSATIPSMDLEYLGIFQGTMPDTDDVNMADVAIDYLTNSLYGCGLTSGMIDSTSNTYYKTYIQAQGLFMSPILYQQEKVSDTFDRWGQLTNTWIFFSGTAIKFVPLGDEAITANGVTYTPNKTIQYDLTVTNGFVDQKVPIKVNRKDPADCYNRTRVTINDRSNQYNSNPIEFKDQTLVDEFGFRDNNDIQGSEITEISIGLMAATLIGKRAAYIRNTYEFTLTSRFIRLEPGDLVTITHPFIAAINKLPVRIQTTKIQVNGNIAITAEEYPGILGTVTLTDQQTTSYSVVNTQADPGDINSPAICEPDSSFAGEPVLLISASGGPDWGGANIYLSFDSGVTYTPVGQISSTGRQGLLTASLPTHAAGLDTTNTLSVDMAQSLTVLEPVNNADASSFRTLSLVAPQPIANVIQQGELLAFGDVSTTGAYTADLTYLERGLYGTSPALHAIGEEFTFYDITGSTGNTVKYILPAQYIGQTVYTKFQSFNIFGNATQDISTVTAYEYSPVGSGFGGGTGGVPLTPTGLTVSPGAGQNLVSWSANAITDNVTSYQLWVASGVGSSFSSATQIWEGLSTNYIHTGLISGSAFTYFLIAVNVIGPSVHTAGVSGTASAPPASVPPGGTTGQALTKNSGTDYDTGWTGPYVQLAGDTMTGQLNGTNLTETGWGNFGSASTPTNTSNGDVTMSRLMVGSNVTFASVSTHGAYLSATLTDTAGGSSAGTYVQPTISPAADSSTNFRGLSLSAQIDTAHNFSGSGTNAISAAWFEGRIINSGTIAEIHGASFNGLWLAGTAASLGTVTEVDGISIIPVESFGNSVAATVTTARGARVLNSGKGSLTLTNQVGLSIDSLTSGTNNTEILLGTSTPQSGNWGIYQAAAVNNAFAGNTRIGSAGTPTASAALDVSSTTGALLIPRMTTTQRNALTASNGMEVYDSTIGAFFDYVAGAWVQRGSGSSGANPTATAGPAAVNGSATTFMRSDGAPAIQKASASQFGIVEVDNVTIIASAGVISTVGGGVSALIGDVTTSGAQASVTFSSIPAGYKDLILEITGASGGAVSSDQINMQLNGDTGGNYDWMRTYQSGTNDTTFNASGIASASAGIGILVGTSGTADYSMTTEVVIPNYAATVFYKSFKATGGGAIAGGSANVWATQNAGLWRSTAAVNAIKVFLATGPFANGTRVTLYGRA